MRTLRILLLNLILSVVAVAVASSAFLLDRLLPYRLPACLIILGWPLCILGSALIIWSVSTLVQESGSSGAPFDPTQNLVTMGLYAWLRNPIYAGDVLLLIGLSFLTYSPFMLLSAVVFMVGIDFFVRHV